MENVDVDAMFTDDEQDTIRHNAQERAYFELLMLYGEGDATLTWRYYINLLKAFTELIDVLPSVEPLIKSLIVGTVSVKEFCVTVLKMRQYPIHNEEAFDVVEPGDDYDYNETVVADCNHYRLAMNMVMKYVQKLIQNKVENDELNAVEILNTEELEIGLYIC